MGDWFSSVCHVSNSFHLISGKIPNLKGADMILLQYCNNGKLTALSSFRNLYLKVCVLWFVFFFPHGQLESRALVPMVLSCLTGFQNHFSVLCALLFLLRKGVEVTGRLGLGHEFNVQFLCFLPF